MFEFDPAELVLRVGAFNGIEDAIDRAIAISAQIDGGPVEFEFNGVTVIVRSDSNPDLIHRDWLRAVSGYINKKNVGPYPDISPTLTGKEKEDDNEEMNRRCDMV